MKRSIGSEDRRSLSWQQPTISLLLILLGAFCFLKYLGWAAVYSGNYGVPSLARLVRDAHQRSLTYFVVCLLIETALIANLAIHLRFVGTELTDFLKVVARVASTTAIAVIGTLGAAYLLSRMGVGWIRGYYDH